MPAKPKPSLRSPPPATSLDAVQSFVTGSPATSSSKPKGSLLERGIVTRAGGKKFRRFTIYVPTELGQRVEALRERRQDETGKAVEISDVVGDALAAYFHSKASR